MLAGTHFADQIGSPSRGCLPRDRTQALSVWLNLFETALTIRPRGQDTVKISTAVGRSNVYRIGEN